MELGLHVWKAGRVGGRVYDHTTISGSASLGLKAEGLWQFLSWGRIHKGPTHTQVLQLAKPTVNALYHIDQLRGFSGSDSESQSTSKAGSVVAVVRTEVVFLEMGWPRDALDSWGVSDFSGSSPLASWIERWSSLERL